MVGHDSHGEKVLHMARDQNQLVVVRQWFWGTEDGGALGKAAKERVRFVREDREEPIVACVQVVHEGISELPHHVRLPTPRLYARISHSIPSASRSGEQMLQLLKGHPGELPSQGKMDPSSHDKEGSG